MSALGYSSNSMNPVQPDPAQYSPASTIAQTVPGYNTSYHPYAPQYGVGLNGAAPGAFQGWNPTSNMTYGGPPKYTYAWDQNDGGGMSSVAQAFGGPSQYHYTQETKDAPWANYIAQLFGKGSIANIAGGDVTGTASPQAYNGTESPNGINHQSSDGDISHPIQSYNNNAYSNQFGNNPNAVDPNVNQATGSTTPDPNDPQSLQQLYAQINGLGTQGLQAASNRIGYFNQAFSLASQNYANAYANPLYARSNPMGQKQTSDWLQASYNTLTNKLDQNGLL